MSVLAVFRWEVDPDALLAAYDWELQQAVPASNPVERNLEAAGWPSDPSSRSTRCMPPSRDWQIG